MNTAARASRVLLEGDVLHIGFHQVGKAPYPEDIVAGGVLRALAQFLRVDLQTEGIFWGDYCFFAGVTGEAFRFLEFMGLGAATPGQPLVERYGHGTQAAMFEQALTAAGLAGQVLLGTPRPAVADLQARIVASLDGRTPVIGFGAFGQPEPFLITGYDHGGQVLLGWSHLQQDRKLDPRLAFEPTGQFRLRDWGPVLSGVVLVSGTQARPPARQVYRDAIERGLLELGTTGTAAAPLGTAAMERWAAHLTDATLGDSWTEERWRQAQRDHDTTGGDLAERRALAASFVELAARALPEAAADLQGAQTAFGASHDTVYEIWEAAANTGPFDPDLAKFRDPARRRTLAALVRRLIACDRRGAAFLRRALAAVDGGDPGPSVAPDRLLDGAVTLVKAASPAAAEPRWAPENIALPNALGMLRQFLGEPFGDLNATEQASPKLDYVLWMGLSGAAFGLLWDGPERAHLDLAFDALGYDVELWLSRQLADDTGLAGRHWGWDDNLRRRIFWNLRDRRLPVLLFHCGPWPDWWLVTGAQAWGTPFRGYGGSSGQSWRPNAPLDHPDNPLRDLRLFEGMQGAKTWTIQLTAQRDAPKPPLDTLYRRAIAWGARKMGQQRMACLGPDGQERLSERPLTDWAAMLRTDALFPAADAATLRQRRQWLEGHEVELAERRFYGAAFLELAAQRLAHPELRQAATHFRQVHTLMQDLWTSLGGLHAPEAHLRLADPAVRAAMADLLLQVEQQDAAAATLLGQAAG